MAGTRVTCVVSCTHILTRSPSLSSIGGSDLRGEKLPTQWSSDKQVGNAIPGLRGRGGEGSGGRGREGRGEVVGGGGRGGERWWEGEGGARRGGGRGREGRGEVEEQKGRSADS